MNKNISKLQLYYPSSDGQHTLHAVVWFPENPKATVQLVHGVSEYADRYDVFARALCSRGYAVAAEDHLGHGGSVAKDEETCFLAEKNGWNTVCNDILTLSSLLKLHFPGLPCFLLGHSMGSFLARTVICNHSTHFDGLILSGTGHVGGVTIFCGRLLAGLVGLFCGRKRKSGLINILAFGPYSKPFAPVRTPFDWICSDPAEVDRYIADAQCGMPITAGLFSDMLWGLRFIKKPKHLSGIRKDLPVYIYSGSHDPVGSMGKGVRKVYQLFKAAGLCDVSLVLYENGRHEMHNEPNKQVVFAALADWLDKRLK